MKRKQKELIKRIIAISCAVLVAVAMIVSLFLTPARAVTQSQINNAAKRAEQAKKEAEEAEAKKKEAIAAFNEIDKQISAAEDEIKRLSGLMEQTQNDITLKEEELRIAQEDLVKHENAFMARARAMYEHKDIKYVELLFQADSLSDFLGKIDMITQIMEYDDKVLKDLKETREKIDNAKRELESILLRQKEDAKKLDERKAALDVVLAEKEKLMKDAVRNAEYYKAIQEQAEAEEQRLINEHKREMSREAYDVDYGGGTMAWPVPGVRRVTSEYGNRIHPVYKTNKFHSGIDIGAGYGTNIIAAADGKVTMATTNGGYGKCIIINHGSAITTLYAHCSELLVGVGDVVKKGDVIAKVGSTGVSTGPHLHFEVRINGATANPRGYVR